MKSNFAISDIERIKDLHIERIRDMHIEHAYALTAMKRDLTSDHIAEITLLREQINRLHLELSVAEDQIEYLKLLLARANEQREDRI